MWRIVNGGVPSHRLRVGQIVSYIAALRSISRSIGQPIYMFATPSDAGQHWSERSWPEVLEIPVELGRPLEAEPVDPAALTQVEKALAEGREARQKASTGLQECRARLEEIERRTKIIGASDQDVAQWRLNYHHEANWSEKLSAAASDVARHIVVIEALRDQQERATRRHTAQPEASSLRTAVELSQQPEGRGEAMVDVEALRRELLRLALVAVQVPGLADWLFVSDDDRRCSLVAFVFPERAYFAWRELRAGLLQWAGATGRPELGIRALRNEGDVAALFALAEHLAEQARQNETNAVEVAA